MLGPSASIDLWSPIAWLTSPHHREERRRRKGRLPGGPTSQESEGGDRKAQACRARRWSDESEQRDDRTALAPRTIRLNLWRDVGSSALSAPGQKLQLISFFLDDLQ